MTSRRRQEQEIEERSAPPGEVVYEAIYKEGDHELGRGVGALGLSGLAAGLSMGFSFLAEASLRAFLPPRPWAPAVSKLGYAVGFLIVILGRQQLFTKNTLTVILPILNPRGQDGARLPAVARLWGVILLSNLLGAFAFAGVVSWPGVFPEEIRHPFDQLAREAISGGFAAMAARSVLAGWLIALIIWLMPFAESAHFWVILILSYVVGLAHLPHVVAGSVDAAYGVWTGSIGFGRYLGGFLAPVFLGNALGGVALVAAGAHAEFVKQGPS